MPLLTQVFGRNHTLALYETWQYSRLTNTPADTLHLTLHCCTKHQFVLFTIYNSPMNCLHFISAECKVHCMKCFDAQCTMNCLLYEVCWCSVYNVLSTVWSCTVSDCGVAARVRPIYLASHTGGSSPNTTLQCMHCIHTAHSTTLHNIAQHCTKLHNTDPHWKHCTTLLNTMAHCPAMHPLNNKAQHYTTLYNQVQHNTAQ